MTGTRRPGDPPRLPHELEQLVQLVTRATGLPLRLRGEVARELRAHFEDGLAAGRDPGELVRSFGDPAAAARAIRTARTGTMGPRRLERRWRMGMGELRGGFLQALRTLWRSPGYAVVVVVTLGLGVGANTAVFTVLDSVLLEPLPYPEPDRLVRIYDVWSERPGELNEYLRSPAVQAYRTWDEVFEGMATLYTYRETGADLTYGERPERVVASQVSAGYFETLGVTPILGRTFREEESLGPGIQNPARIGARVAILTHGLWERLFGADPEIAGRTIQLNGESYEVVGVMPAGFTNPMGSPPDLWVPEDLRLRQDVQDDWNNHYLTGIARLAPGLTVEAAQARVDALNARLSQAEPGNRGWEVALRPLHATIVGSERRALLWLLAGAVGLVLLSACVNVANLVFARGLGRDRDIAVRGALGAGRGRTVLHLLSETGLLAAAGCVTGLALGWIGVRLLLSVAPDALPVIVRPALSGRVFLFGLGCTGLALLVFGLLPALRLSRTPPAEVLRAGGRGGTETRGLRRIRSALVVAQMAVAVTLVAGAGLLVRSFQALRAVELGVDDRGVLTFEVHLPPARYPDGDARHRFHETFQERIRALPQVEAVGAVSWLPVNGRYHWWSMAVAPGWDGTDPDGVDGESWIDTDVRVFAGDYFQSVGLALLQGTAPGETDLAGAPVTWLNQMAAETAFPDRSPLGEFVYVGGAPRRVVGVVEDAPFDPRGATSRKTYIPHAQYADNRNWALIQTVRVRGGMAGVRERLREELARVDGDLVLYHPRPLSALLAEARAQDRFATLLMSVFALLALTLAAVGSYGVLAGTVARRRREIGIRLALGAQPGRVRSMILGSSLRMSALGVGVGLLLAWGGSRWLREFLFQVGPSEPWIFLAGGGLLLALGLLAGWIPARQATRVQPVETLGAE